MRKYITIIALLLFPLLLNAQYVGGLSSTGLKGYVEQTDFDTVHVATSGLWINDVQVTATAAELNYLDIASLGTGAASKAVVLDTGDDYTWPNTGVLTYGGTGITATGAELNYLDITTLGTGAASKAVVLDSGDDYTWPGTGVLTYGVLNDGSDDITSTAAEINVLDGIAATLTYDELDYLDVTAGTAAASKAVVLDGSSKIDALDITTLSLGGVTVTASAADLNAIPTTTSTAAELNYLDIASLGTGAASKAVVLDTGDDYTWPNTGVLTYGVLNDGSDNITATAAELNILDDATATYEEINYLDIAALGTGAASKAVVLDSGDDYTWPGTGVLTYGVLNDGSDNIDATAAEINRIADKTASVVDVTSSTVSITLATHGDRVITLNRAAGITVTLPLATGTGASYTFVVGTTITSNSLVIQVGDGSDTMDGGLAFGVDTDGEGATGYTWSAAAGDDTVTMDGTSQGGVVGDYVKCIDYATDSWYIEVHLQQSGGAEATPFSSAV